MRRLIMLTMVAIVAATTICSAQGGLNEIRFGGWSDEQWYDNDYIRELRSYIDACGRGEVRDEVLEAHSDITDSKFCVGEIDCSIFGGAYIWILFLDDTSKVFGAHVYSDVDEDKGEVVGYEVRSIVLEDDACPFTRESVLSIVRDNPIHKLW